MPKREYLKNIGSAYSLLLLQIFYGLASIPLALYYLGDSRFGVWAVSAQVAIWLQLLDAGMSGALARYLIDYRIDKGPERCHACIGTGFRIAVLQGTLVGIIGVTAGPSLVPLLKIPESDASEFASVLAILGINGALSFLVKPIQSWFYACRRLDYSNWIAFSMTILEWLSLWILLRSGYGLISLAYARSVAVLFSLVAFWLCGVKFANFPIIALAHNFDKAMFRQIGGFAISFFLLTLGTQLIMATQMALVSRYLGVSVAAVWLAAPKLYQLCNQMLAKLWDYSVPRFSEMMARGEIAAIREGFHFVFRSIACLGGLSLGCLAALNSTFLERWTAGKIEWDSANNVLMVGLIYSNLLARCFTDFTVHTKRIGLLSWLMIAEGVVFITGSALLMPVYGLKAMISMAIISGLMFRLPYAFCRVKFYLRFEHCDLMKFLRMVSTGLVLAMIGYLSISVLLRLIQIAPIDLRILLGGIVTLVLTSVTLWTVCISEEQRDCIRLRIGRILNKV